MEVSDRIALTLTAPEATLAAARTHADLIAEETLATSVDLVEGGEVSVG